MSLNFVRNAFHNLNDSGNLGKFGKHFNGHWSKERFNILQDTEAKSEVRIGKMCQYIYLQKLRKMFFDDESKNVLEKVCICMFSSADIDPNKQKGKLSFYRQSSICSIIVHLRIM